MGNKIEELKVLVSVNPTAVVNALEKMQEAYNEAKVEIDKGVALKSSSPAQDTLVSELEAAKDLLVRSGYMYSRQDTFDKHCIDTRYDSFTEKCEQVVRFLEGSGFTLIKEGTMNVTNVTNNHYLEDKPLTKRQLEQVSMHIKDELAKDLREDRLRSSKFK
ncbi:hypothetical protein [Priestia aryabhattai]|uniref:hypothetical protein n=1 Tax=Priestia aryabhattai TaxID=412384 RepID=UPI003CA73B6A